MSKLSLYIDACNELCEADVETHVLTKQLRKRYGVLNRLSCGLTTVVYNTTNPDIVFCVTAEKQKIDYLGSISLLCDLSFRLIKDVEIEDGNDSVTYYVYQMKFLHSFSKNNSSIPTHLVEAADNITTLYKNLESVANKKGKELLVNACNHIIPYMHDDNIVTQLELAIKTYAHKDLNMTFADVSELEDRHIRGVGILDVHIDNVMYNSTTKQLVILDPAFMGKSSRM